MGLHNWVQFYLQEKHNHVDYKGYKARDNKDTVGRRRIAARSRTIPALINDPFPCRPVARRRRPRPEPAVQLEGPGEAHRRLLHRRESRVRGGSFHHRLPDVHREDDLRGGQGARVRAGAGRLSARSVHRNVLPQTAQQQQQRSVNLCSPSRRVSDVYVLLYLICNMKDHEVDCPIFLCCYGKICNFKHESYLNAIC